MRDTASDLLECFHLEFDDIRVMQRAKGTIISGSTVTALIPSIPKFAPSGLDFFTKRGSAATLLFS
jgi:hypothetical protein